MKKKFQELIDRNNDQELKNYFAKMPAGRPLDTEDEIILLENCADDAIKAYYCRFRFSQRAELLFLERAPADMRLSYINLRGLSRASQKYLIDENRTDIATEFLKMRNFEDIDYLLKNGSSTMILTFVRQYSLQNDQQVEKLLYNENRNLFKAYVDHDHFISEDILRQIIEKEKISAFNAVVRYNYRNFVKKSRSMTYQQMVEKKIAGVILPEELQIMVLDTASPMLISPLLETTPLYPKVQNELFRRNYDLHWIKLHASHLYGKAGYRFTPELEKKMFSMLASKDMDEFLTNVRLNDDVTFVTCASFKAIEKYIKERWLSDDAQVALINRGNGDIIRQLISRYTPEHGLCWQAEVALVKLGSMDLVKSYISFHSMCSEALGLLRRYNKATLEYYYQHHAY